MPSSERRATLRTPCRPCPSYSQPTRWPSAVGPHAGALPPNPRHPAEHAVNDTDTPGTEQRTSLTPDKTEFLSFRFHPRALAALGKELVTSDVVAIMELVKNSYDALASRVEVRVRRNEDQPGSCLEILDNGEGMTEDTIKNVWCVVATPFRHDQPVISKKGTSRTATGEKGLGRLSAARLGRSLHIITKTETGSAMQFVLDWDDQFRASENAMATFPLRPAPRSAFPYKKGTLIRITRLNDDWGDKKIEKLKANLSRFLSPFASGHDFSLLLEAPDEASEAGLQEIQPPAFMSEPTYSIEGSADASGTISWTYHYRPLAGDGRTVQRTLEWPALRTPPAETQDPSLGSIRPSCGPFAFEIRAWDLTVEDVRDLADHFKESRSHIRAAIKSQWGVSLYRDDVLVLPKSFAARDWLGMDLRRVSKVGPRLSTHQVVGCVRITKSDNPDIRDTSDRESLVSNPASASFRETLLAVLRQLEVERSQDRRRDEGDTQDIFADLDAESLVEELEGIRNRGGTVEETVKAAKNFETRLKQSRNRIRRRFGYYNRLAVVGTIAQMVIHEIRNRTTAIGRALRKVGRIVDRFGDPGTKKWTTIAHSSVEALDSLAERFTPLASRAYRPGRRSSLLEESIGRCVAFHRAELRSRKISVESPSTTATRVRIDPAELDTILLNLISNSIYWLGLQPRDRMLRFRVRRGLAGGRVRVSVDDSGPGIETGDEERVFWPGVTRKPDGIGMGLTVAAELVEAHGGRMRTSVSGALGGATLEFDLPLFKAPSPK